MLQLVNWSKTPLSPDYRGSGSFATFMIIGGKFPAAPARYVTGPSNEKLTLKLSGLLLPRHPLRVLPLRLPSPVDRIPGP